MTGVDVWPCVGQIRIRLKLSWLEILKFIWFGNIVGLQVLFFMFLFYLHKNNMKNV